MLKYLLSTFPLLLLSLGLGVSAYGICEQTIDSLLEVLESDPSVQQQIELLAPLCSEIEDEEARKHCDRNIHSYWSYFVDIEGLAFYRNIFRPVEVLIYVCEDNTYENESECINCASRLSALSSVMTWEQTISFLISLAQGELFCDMDNSFWDIEVCQAEWEWLMPRILETLANWIVEDSWANTFCEGNMHCSQRII